MTYQSKVGQYRKRSIETSGKLELLLMCYEKAIQKLQEAKAHFEAKEFERKARALQKALDIIHELQCTLDFERGGQIATNLDALYTYVVRRLTEGDVNKDTGAYEEAIHILSELKEAWEGIGGQLGTAGTVQNGQAGFHSEPLAA
jgi:flagellar secretion chaperone FliS